LSEACHGGDRGKEHDQEVDHQGSQHYRRGPSALL
jgi:hypothetical protein